MENAIDPELQGRDVPFPPSSSILTMPLNTPLPELESLSSSSSGNSPPVKVSEYVDQQADEQSSDYPSSQQNHPISIDFTQPNPVVKNTITVTAGTLQGSLSTSRSLIRRDRAVLSPDNRNFFYTIHTADSPSIAVIPSSTGNHPNDYTPVSSSNIASNTDPPNQALKFHKSSSIESIPRQYARSINLDTPDNQIVLYKQPKFPLKVEAPSIPHKSLSLWMTYCSIITIPFVPLMLKWMGIKEKEQQQAWREKMGLISLIFALTFFVGFFTFAFNSVVCGTPLPRTHYSSIPPDSVVIHGTIFNISSLIHPTIPKLHQNVKASKRDGKRKLTISLTPESQMPLIEYAGGKDASLLFQNVNGNCKPFIKPASDAQLNSSIYVNSYGEFSQYFPCILLDMQGSFVSPIVKDQQNKKMRLNMPNYFFEFKESCHLAPSSRDSFYSMGRSNDVYYSWDDIKQSHRSLVVYLGDVIDISRLKLLKHVELLEPFKSIIASAFPLHGNDISTLISANSANRHAGKCLVELAKVGFIETDTVGCITSHVVLFLSLTFIFSIVLVKFAFALYFEWFLSWQLGTNFEHIPLTNAAASIRTVRTGVSIIIEAVGKVVNKIDGNSGYLPEEPSSHTNTQTLPNEVSSTASISKPEFRDIYPTKSVFLEGTDPIYTLFLVTSYSESEKGVRSTLDSLATCNYPNDHKLIIVICDGLITGSGNAKSTPDIVLSMMKDFVISPDITPMQSYVAIATGAKRHNKATAYAGYYAYSDKTVPLNSQVRIPMICVVKQGNDWERETPGVKAGNRGKRDSQVLLMGFLQKIMFNERMCDLENYLYLLIWQLVGRDVMDYETVLMVDADTKILPDSLEHLVSCMMKDPNIMGLCGETQIANKRESWVTMIQVFEYFISHHLTKSFESVFGGVTCLPGCFSLYRIKAPKGPKGYWVPILANPDIVERYSDNEVSTLHRKNLLLLGEDRYLSTLMLKTFPKRKQLFVPQAKCETIAPSEFRVLLDQRRRWINSTVHNLMELVIVRDLCGVFCVSMQCVVLIELIGTLTLPAALAFTIYLLAKSVIARPIPLLPLLLLAFILGLPGLLILVTAHQWSYVLWMVIYLISLPIWNFVLPLNAFWKFDDFSWGNTREVEGDTNANKDDKTSSTHAQFDDSKIQKMTFTEWMDAQARHHRHITPTALPVSSSHIAVPDRLIMYDSTLVSSYCSSDNSSSHP